MNKTDKQLLNRMRSGRFVANNGCVLRTINLLRHKYESLVDVQYALSDISEDQFLDSVNFLSEAGYINLRYISSKEPAVLADADYTELEAKVSAVGIRLLGGEITDKMVET